MRMTLIQLGQFVADWRRLKLADEDLVALETMLLDNPTVGPVMSGTGGLRKVRFAPPTWHTGKSGAARVGYVYFPEFDTLYLVLIFGKNQKSNLTPEERNAVAALIPRLRAALAKAHGAQTGGPDEEEGKA